MNTEIRFEGSINLNVPEDSDDPNAELKAVQNALGSAGVVVLEVLETLAPVGPEEERYLT